MRYYHGFIILLLLASSNSTAVKFKYQKEPVTKEFVFGDTLIVRSVHIKESAPLGDHQIFIYYKGELQASYRGLSFDFIVPDKTNSTFVALSNFYLPPVAALVFTSKGVLENVIYHRKLSHSYCYESMVDKQWVDKLDPKIEFIYDKIEDFEYIKDITFINCHGKRVSLE
jgi:hypothetical protein